MASRKKAHLKVVAGGKKDVPPAPAKRRQVLAQDRPLIGIVRAEQLDPAKGLRAKDYVHRTYHENKVLEGSGGRSRIYPEINVLNSAKAWYRSMIRLARSEGYSDVKKFFKESDLVNDHDKRLADAVLAFIEWENKLPRGG